MTRNEVVALILESNIIHEWHWFRFHFNHCIAGVEHPLATSVIDALLKIERKTPGYAEQFINRLAAISGREMDLDHYQQLLQSLSELYVLCRVVEYFSDSEYLLEHEPTVIGSGRNPEFQVVCDGVTFCVEVKAPSLLSHICERDRNAVQISTRVPNLREGTQSLWGDSITSPRDNPVKDFLLSANTKFEGFKRQNQNYVSLLFINWDDCIYEPISALIGNPSGLLCEGSFARDEDDNRIIFPNVDLIVLDRHLINIINATKDLPLNDSKRHAMDYGRATDFPPKAVIQCPDSNTVVAEVVYQCLQLQPIEECVGAEYGASDLIFWVNGGE